LSEGTPGATNRRCCSAIRRIHIRRIPLPGRGAHMGRKIMAHGCIAAPPVLIMPARPRTIICFRGKKSAVGLQLPCPFCTRLYASLTPPSPRPHVPCTPSHSAMLSVPVSSFPGQRREGKGDGEGLFSGDRQDLAVVYRKVVCGGGGVGGV
jgi:hypothetical protein